MENRKPTREQMYTIALQTLYFAKQQEQGRYLTADEMIAAQDTASAFVNWYDGPFDVRGTVTGRLSSRPEKLATENS